MSIFTRFTMRYFLRFLELNVLQGIGFYAEILLTCNLYLPQRRSLKCRLLLKVYKKRYNETRKRPRGVAKGGTRSPSDWLYCWFWKGRLRRYMPWQALVFVRTYVLAGSRIVASQLVDLIITRSLWWILYKYLFSSYTNLFSISMCLSILKIYSSDSLKLRFPVVMPNCLWTTSELPFAFLEK